MRLVHVNETHVKPIKKLPMDKDPVFLAQLRQEIIHDHNKKVRERKLNNT